MKAAVIVNKNARRIRHDRGFPARLAQLLAEAGIDASVDFCRGRGLTDRLRELRQTPADTLIIVGGDGTISTAAAACLSCDRPLGIIPAGTHNHFARDLCIPVKTADAVACIARGHSAKIDVGDVNGVPFVNNSSVGAYPHAVEERDLLVDRFGLRKSVAQILATLRVFARKPVIHAKLEVDGRIERCESPFIFVGNNEYRVRPFEQRLRSSLSAGRLCVFTTAEKGLSGFFKLFGSRLLAGWKRPLALRRASDKTFQFILESLLSVFQRMENSCALKPRCVIPCVATL